MTTVRRGSRFCYIEITYTDGTMVCSICGRAESYGSTKLRRGKRVPCDINIRDMKLFAHRDGWRATKGRKPICPTCRIIYHDELRYLSLEAQRISPQPL